MLWVIFLLRRGSEPDTVTGRMCALSGNIEDRHILDVELVFSPLSKEIQDRTGEPVMMPLSIAQVSAARLL